jgi:exopolysaccharide biosynthesis protein
MKRILHSLFAVTLLAATNILHAEFSATNQLLPGIIYYSETRTNPPTRLFVAEIDLKNPKLHVRVAPGGADPDGTGKWQTSLMIPTEIAKREKFDLVVNGDFFEANNVKDAEGKASGYRAGQSALVVGSAMTDGKTWSVSATPRPCLIVHTNHTITIETIQKPPADDWEVISGNTLLVKDGKDVAPPVKAQHPRTVVGLDAAGTKLTLLVVDGRKPGIAVGMTYHELAQEMLQLGCRQALNLDGGGSSVMAIRDASSGKMKILNAPTDGRERAVANTLGISADK